MSRSRMRILANLAFFMMTVTGTSLAGVRYDVVLNGPNAGTASAATGTAVLILNDAQDELTYEITHTGLEGKENAAHFHYGPPGAVAPILLTLPLGSPKTGVWSLSPEDLGFLLAGEVFILVHSDVYMAGEIRGNVTQGQVATEKGTWGSVKGLFR